MDEWVKNFREEMNHGSFLGIKRRDLEKELENTTTIVTVANENHTAPA